MIDFLKDCYISNDTLKIMNEKYPAELFDLNCNKKEIVKIINYLRSIGVSNIDELLIYETHLFYKTKSWIESRFSNYNINELVSKINENYEEIEIIF